MSASLKIISPGLSSTLQDKGRYGYGSFGVPRCGAADPVSLRLGNALVENEPYEAAMEFRLLGPTISAQDGSVRVGLATHAPAILTEFQSGETRHIGPWQTITLNEGDSLKLLPLPFGATGYLTIEGGLDLEPVLGSKSTYARARMGGVTGLPLQARDILKTRSAPLKRSFERIVANFSSIDRGPIRVIPGPQDDYFSADELANFLDGKFCVSSDVDRMGIRLEGEEIQALPEKGYDLVSDGLVPGAIQVPGNGQPIILGVDCQSVGGYPKIATVISADLHRLGQIAPGDDIHFQGVDLAGAKNQLLKLEKSLASAIESIRDLEGEGGISIKALYLENLVGGVVDALKPGHLEDMA